MNMSEFGTFGDFFGVKCHHLETSLKEPSGFEESFRMVMSLLHFVTFHPVDLATVFHCSWRFVIVKSAFLKICQMMKISFDMPFLEGYANFSGPAGGRSLALAVFLTWCEAL